MLFLSSGPLDQYGIGTTRMRMHGRCRIAFKEGS
jgi:hypothetical protein